MMEAKCTKRNQNRDTNICKSLSDLPDEVLRHILTKLSTKDVVKMSTLSKEFEELCTAVGVLKISQNKFKKMSLFREFVDSALYLPYGQTPSTKVFHLSCDVLPNASRVNRWISIVISGKIEVLYLSLQNLNSRYRLPSCLFNSHSLTTFYLDMPFILILPSSINFPSLKILKLEHVTFVDVDLTQQLLSSPVLEKLYIFRCLWTRSISICTPKLQTLSIDESDSDSEEQYDWDIELFCTNLKSFYYKGDLRQTSFGIHCSLSLVEVTIDFHFSNDFPLLHKHIKKILRGLTHARDLSFLGKYVEALEYGDGNHVGLPMFDNLTKLKLYGGYICFDHGPFLHLLSKFPRLTVLELVDVSILEHSDQLIDFDINNLILDPVPPCFQSHLKIIIISNSYVPPIGALLKAAEVLETMIIYTHSSADVEEDIQKLQSLRRDLNIIRLFSGQALPPAPIPN